MQMPAQAEIVQVLGSPEPQDVAAMLCTDNSITPAAVPTMAGMPWHDVLQITLASGSMSSTSYGPEFEDLLSSLLCWQPTARLSAVQVLAHPFFAPQRSN